MKTIILSIFLLSIVLFPMQAINFAGGSGTENDPYQIQTADQLNAVRENMTAHFILKNNIDLSATEDYLIWRPIGRKEPSGFDEAFSGSFDGDGYVITGLNVMVEGSYGGLFCVVSGTIMNLGVKGQVTGNNGSGFGLVAGYLGQPGVPGLMENCFAEGSVTVTGSTGSAGNGLLLGNLTNASSVRSCFAKGNVSAAEMQFVGGLVGRMMHNTCSLFDSYAETNVVGKTNVGGVTGRLYSKDEMNAGFLYAIGRVIGEDWVGGIAGDFYNINASSIIAANSSITATKSGANVARVAPIGSGTPMLEFIYGLSSTEVKIGSTNQTVVSDDTGKDGATRTSAQLHSQDFYEEMGWDLEMTWEMPDATGYPILQWQKNIHSGIDKKLAGVPFTVFTQGKMIHVQNIEIGSDIYVYNASGQLLKQQKSQGEADVILLAQPGVYLVKVVGANVSGSTKAVCE